MTLRAVFPQPMFGKKSSTQSMRACCIMLLVLPPPSVQRGLPSPHSLQCAVLVRAGWQLAVFVFVPGM